LGARLTSVYRLGAELDLWPHCGVPKADLTSIEKLLPSALASLARASGNARHLQPAWARIVGPIIARQAWPVLLKGDLLVIEVASRQWARELAEREAEIRGRLAPWLGKPAISRLVFKAAE
jgi:predicted nucleic acid-binding Zn ribbon protein